MTLALVKHLWLEKGFLMLCGLELNFNMNASGLIIKIPNQVYKSCGDFLIYFLYMPRVTIILLTDMFQKIIF